MSTDPSGGAPLRASVADAAGALPGPGGEGRQPASSASDQDQPERYTHGHHESVLRAHRRRTAETSAGYLLDHLRPGMRVLDVGCGPGSITCDLAERVAPGTVVGIDRSEDALTEARRTAAARGVAGASFDVGDVYHLDFDDDSFDVVHAHQVLQHLVHPVAALREMRRVCRPGGIVAARDADYAAFTWAPADPALDLWLRTYRQAARANGAEPDAGRHLLGWANAAGFTEVAAGASTWCYATPDDRGWWGSTSAERVTRSALAEQFREQGLADDDLYAIAEAWHRWAEHPDGWFLVPHGEILARP